MNKVADESLKPKRRKADSELDITPMIDIVFLLLAFFVVASKMDPQKVVDMPQAKNGKPVYVDKSVILIVEQNGDAPLVSAGKNGERTFLTTGDELEAEIEEYVRTTIEASNLKIETVVIKAEKDIPNRVIQPVFQAAKEGSPEGFEIRAATKEKN